MNVLLIEPDSVLRSTYSRALEQAGHATVSARDAQQAILFADTTTPDVVVLELQLPGHSGIEFLYEFRSYPEWQHAPVILHTFIAGLELTSRAELGVAEYLYKPASNLRQLVRAVNGVAPARL